VNERSGGMKYSCISTQHWQIYQRKPKKEIWTVVWFGSNWGALKRKWLSHHQHTSTYVSKWRPRLWQLIRFHDI